MSRHNLFELLGIDNFWNEFDVAYPNFKKDNIWYEVYIDFMEDEYEPEQTLQYNLEKAKQYLENHKNDYE